VTADDELTVADAPEQSRFELRRGGELLGVADYRPGGRSLIIAHTEIGEGHEGEGLGSTLVGTMLDQLRADGRTIIPLCPFTAAYVTRHPEYADVVDPSFRR
jgi:predicted GNAT family acetyltransferase